jgi:hypothetical protein
MQAPLDGGAPTALVSGIASSYFAFDSDYVFSLGYTLDVNGKPIPDSGTINAAPLDGGPSSVLAAGLVDPTQIQAQDGVLYWTSLGGLNGPFSLVAMPIDAGGTYTIVSPALDTNEFALSPTTLVWFSEARVMAAPLTDLADAAAIASGIGPNVGPLTADALNAYWEGYGPLHMGALVEVALAGGATVPLTDGGGVALALAADGTNLYSTNGAVVLKTPIDGGPSTVIAYQTDVTQIVVDSTSVSWITSGLHEANTVMRLTPK